MARCKDGPWPLRPDCITSDYWIRSDGSEDECPDNIFGLIRNMYMQGIQAVISDNVGSPSTIIEIIPRAGRQSGYECRRTDSSLLRHTMCCACEYFRQVTLSPSGNESAFLCRRCDDYHALLLRHLACQGWKDEKKEQYLGENRLTQENETDIPNENIMIRDVNTRPYVEYNCPYLGFRETLFPIFVEGRLLATLFEGQIILDTLEHLNLIKDRSNTILDRFPSCFDEYCSKEQCNEQDVLKELQELVNNVVSNDNALQLHSNCPHGLRQYSQRSGKRSEVQYKDLIGKADASIRTLEGILHDELRSQRRARVRTVVHEASKKLDDLSSLSATASDNKDSMLKTMQKTMDCMRVSFSLRYVVMFTAPDRLQPTSYLKPLIVSVHAGVNGEILEACRIDVTSLPPSWAYDVALSNFADSSLLKCLQCHDRNALGEFVLIAVPVHFQISSPPFFLIGLRKDSLSAPENIASEKDAQLKDNDLYGSLQPFFTLIGSALASFIASSNARIEGEELRYLSHELSQQCDGLDNIRLRYMTDPEEFKKLTIKKAEDINRNMKAYLKQLRSIMEFAKKLASVPLPVPWTQVCMKSSAFFEA